MARSRADSNWRRVAAVFAGGLLIVALLCGAAALQRVIMPSAYSSQPLDTDGIYSLTNVWTIHLEFAPDLWEAMEPKGGGNAFFGSGPAGRQGGFGGAREDRALAPVVMSQGDFNRDGHCAAATDV